jgi:AraC-like DNA-binding protein
MHRETIRHTYTLVHFGDDSIAYAGRHLHETDMRLHTHSFVEMAIVVSGTGSHRTQAGLDPLGLGDVVFLRPGVWHGYQDCADLVVHNCCFSAELLHRELAWTREDPVLGHLLWTGPYAGQRRGVLSTHLPEPERAACVEHLDALSRLTDGPLRLHRGDIVARLSLALGHVARAALGEAGEVLERVHPSVVEAMRRMEARPAHPWTLTELAGDLHLAPGYLVRLFKLATGLPPMAFLSRHRVELAAEQLLHTDRPINVIGESVGWPDPNYFARRFRSHFGLSASAYRAQFARPGALRLGQSSRTADR